MKSDNRIKLEEIPVGEKFTYKPPEDATAIWTVVERNHSHTRVVSNKIHKYVESTRKVFPHKTTEI